MVILYGEKLKNGLDASLNPWAACIDLMLLFLICYSLPPKKKN